MAPARSEYQYQGGGIQDSPLLFLAPTPLGVLELIGVIGMVWYRGRVWWGKPMLLLTGGIYAYWLLGLAAFVLVGRHLLLQDTPRLTSLMLASAGVLTIAHAAPRLVRLISIRTVPAGLPTLALCLLSIFVAFTAWQAWMPGGPPSATGLYQPGCEHRKKRHHPRVHHGAARRKLPGCRARQHPPALVPHRPHREGRGIRARHERRTGHPVSLRATVRLS